LIRADCWFNCSGRCSRASNWPNNGGAYRGRKRSLNAKQIQELRKRIATGEKKAVSRSDTGEEAGLHQDYVARCGTSDSVQGEVTMARKCINCESRKGMTRFENETFSIDHAGMSTRVEGLSGWRCDVCGEVEFDAESARRYAAAGDDLVLRERARQSKDIRRIRRKLGLSQVAAARLAGGGHNAFSRYKRGEAMPMPAVINLFRLLDKHPELLKDLPKTRNAR
jgi:HTH-type transcriptional regulator/antitoxin MqsA